jgi:hypothetical protein
MQTEYNLEFLLENTGCYEKSKVENLFPKEREVVSYEDILQSSIPLQDKYWFFCLRVFTDSQNQHLAIKIAEVVLPIFEEQYPSDNRPRKAIEAARLYLAGEIDIEELETARAAWAAAEEAARVVARAAEEAARVVALAAEEAAWAAWAAWAAARAAANPKYKKELEELLINFIEENK